MVTIMTRVAAMTMRATNSTLPGYRVSSSLSHPHNQLWPPLEAGKDCAMDAISVPADYDHGRLAHSQQIRGRILNAHSNRKPGRQMQCGPPPPKDGRSVWTAHRRLPAFRVRCALAALRGN